MKLTDKQLKEAIELCYDGKCPKCPFNKGSCAFYDEYNKYPHAFIKKVGDAAACKKYMIEQKLKKL